MLCASDIVGGAVAGERPQIAILQRSAPAAHFRVPAWFRAHSSSSFPHSLLGAMGQCPFTMDRPSWAVGHLPRDAMAVATSHSHEHLHDQAVGCGNFRRGSRSVQRGGFHVHAEHYSERRSDAGAGQPPNVHPHRTSPLLSLLGPHSPDDRGWGAQSGLIWPFWQCRARLGVRNAGCVSHFALGILKGAELFSIRCNSPMASARTRDN